MIYTVSLPLSKVHGKYPAHLLFFLFAPPAPPILLRELPIREESYYTFFHALPSRDSLPRWTGYGNGAREQPRQPIENKYEVRYRGIPVL